VEVNLEDMVVETSYQGPRLDNGVESISKEFVVEMMDYLKQQKVLHKKYATMIILKCRDIFEKEKSLVDIKVPETEGSEITVCGDIHGQYYDLLNIFSINGNPSETNPYLFNGDFIDRGSFAVEVIMTLCAWKVLYPKHFFMSRGNHESKNLNKLYGFENEVKHKYDIKTYDLFSDMFCCLPIGHCINGKVLVVHGGLFAKDGVKLDDIRAVNRRREPPDEGIMCETLWSDPCDMDGRHPSKRGVGVQFGPDIARKFLDDNNLSKLHFDYFIKCCRVLGEKP
jgi:serine/threonine-protein phosphatase 5